MASQMLNVFRRQFSTSLTRRSTAAAHGPAAEDAAGTAKTWKYMSFLVALPGVMFCMVNAYKGEMEHKAHLAHHKPEFVAYSHLRIRTKAFPWGDGNHSLFHNAESNALPEGYEE
ncbi:cytochrome c oxidase subunit 6A, mitochondrial-like [Lytechinus pictus]|uniref:cytochrome c oxidase subunit 6A, mitochondrial-like n=1 Tax=Lytechinus pictus TaxID=7653 RepID=UPI00240D2079|nr:cytochrome c oxidase subunit 6A, mitochondrial-like [Lytechinus pictus]XP_054771629.1 cytochrome c oxidase subunit 6A, mitochondrial-like [Lytechinus pictus]